ncbi:hypothetical protein [Arthrobacter sp. efr-133-TYG-120]|uniref:hypothetical protein n=1 Tax=Arthrobacter sp. efr-133-TYG-120 TaxID=3040280 RepID=UPI00254D3E49|nr:hypothetical protein [Arthrobacter sp. efr-133-TYG-120]
MEATIQQLREALDTGEVSSKELVLLYEERIETYDKAGEEPKRKLLLGVPSHLK